MKIIKIMKIINRKIKLNYNIFMLINENKLKDFYFIILINVKGK